MSKEYFIQQNLANVEDTSTMIKKFLNLVKNHLTESSEYFSSFKAIYGDQPYYNHVKDSIIDQVDAIGIDVEVAENIL